MDYLNEQIPRVQEIINLIAHAVVHGDYKEDYQNKFGQHFIDKYVVSLSTFAPEIIEDLVEENKLSTEYGNLMASAKIEFEGETHNLSVWNRLCSLPIGKCAKASFAMWAG